MDEELEEAVKRHVAMALSDGEYLGRWLTPRGSLTVAQGHEIRATVIKMRSEAILAALSPVLRGLGEGSVTAHPSRTAQEPPTPDNLNTGKEAP